MGIKNNLSFVKIRNAEAAAEAVLTRELPVIIKPYNLGFRAIMGAFRIYNVIAG